MKTYPWLATLIFKYHLQALMFISKGLKEFMKVYHKTNLIWTIDYMQ